MLPTFAWLFTSREGVFPWGFVVPGALLLASVLYLVERRRWTSLDRNVTFVERTGPTP